MRHPFCMFHVVVLCTVKIYRDGFLDETSIFIFKTIVLASMKRNMTNKKGVKTKVPSF